MSAAKGPNCNKVAVQVRVLLEPLIWSEGLFFKYHDGCWHKLDDITVKKAIKTTLKLKSTQFRINEIEKNLRLDCCIDPKQLNRYTNLLNVRNGMLDLSTFKLLPHKPLYYSTIQLPVSYQPDAKYPKWRRFLREVFQSDKDAKEKIRFYQEWLGYSLKPDVRQEKCVILLGPGANGKGTCISVIEHILGGENCSAISLEKLKDYHYLAGLRGKLLNVSAEAGTAFFKHTDILKQLISGDSITCDKKYEHEFTFKPYVRFMFAMNELPGIHDTSHGFFRRLVILEFKQTFAGKKCDRGLREKLLKESDGIFLWAVRGLKRLEKRGYFLEPSSSIDRVALYREETNSVLLFIKEECVLDPNGSVPAGGFYKRYQGWAKENGHQPVSSVKFPEQVMRHFGNQITKPPRGYRGFQYKGIRMNMSAPIKSVQGMQDASTTLHDVTTSAIAQS